MLIALYNRFVRLRNRVDNAWAQIEVQLKRRWDLIPNLVETVKGYAAHERGTFEAVTEARAAAQRAASPAETAAAEGILGQALGRLFAVAEAYPELQADENFRQLQSELAETENRIAVSRQVYNDTVLTYNNAIQTFPGVLIAGPFGFSKREFFEVEDDAQREVPAGRASSRVRRPRLGAARGGSAARLASPSRAARSIAPLSADVAVRRPDRRVARSSRSRSRSPSPTGSRSASATSLCGTGETHRQRVRPRGGEPLCAGISTSRRRSPARDLRRVDDVGRGQGSSGTSSRATSCARSRSRTACRASPVAYDDVVDVNVKVWGDQWEDRLAG